MLPIYSDKHTIQIRETNPDFTLSLTSIMSIFLDCVGKHCDLLGVDLKSLIEEQNARWIVSKIKLVVDKIPMSGDTLTVSTWPLKAGFVKFERDFDAKFKDGKSSFRISSDWCVLDTVTKKLRKSETVKFPPLNYETKRGVTEQFEKFSSEISEQDFIFTKEIRFTDIDQNNHTNNAVYSKITMDCFTLEEINSLSLKSYEINFLAQSFYGDKIDVFKKKVSDTTYVILGKTQSTNVFKSIISFENK